MTPQSNFMIVAPIIDGMQSDLEHFLNSMNFVPGRVDPNNSLISFAQFDTLHSARLVIIQSNTGEEIRAFGQSPHQWPASLALIGEVDGNASTFMATMAIVASAGLRQLFAHCEGFASHKGTLLDFLKRHQIESAASYVNWIGRTVIQVRQEASLQHSLSAKLASIIETTGRENIRQLRQQLLTHVEIERSEGRLTLSPEAPTPWRYKIQSLISLIGLPVLLLLVSPVLLLLSPVILWRLRTLEKNDPDIDIRPEPEHSQALAAIEDLDVTNQFNIFGDVKPGWFRLWLLKSILAIVNYSARHIYRRGFLARVRTIHFARWVFLNENRSVYFGSMYDGSLESYMDDFINKVAFGLNLTFSHGVGYPRTRWIIKGGAELEQPFKATLRRHQLPSQVWYRANPGLTAHDMARNARIRRGLENYPRDDEAIRLWLEEI